MSKVHWAAAGGEDWSYSACGVGNGNREGEEWESTRLKSEVTCKSCLNWLTNYNAKLLKSREAFKEARTDHDQ
jgi:hypothetical protein